MPRSQGTVVENSFVNGFVTESTGLNFPENAVQDTNNCVFDDKGNVYRRAGFDYEADYVLDTEDRALKAITSYTWQNVGTNANLSFQVVQVGETLKFYSVGFSGALSAGLNVNEISLNTFLVSGAPSPADTECSFSNGMGYLFVTHPNCDPFYVKYNLDTDNFTATRITLKIRDLEGVDDGLGVDTRPSTLSNAHKYNLYNQGWYTQATWGDNSSGTSGTGNVLTVWGNLIVGEPSNADIWWLFKGAANDGTKPSAFRPSVYLHSVAIGNSPAPKGHYQLELHRQDRTAVSGITGQAVVSTGLNRVSCNAFFAGRVFYSGLPNTGFIGKVYFTQIIERDSQLGECFQLMDPTSENNSDLLPSDGGVISITEAGRILKLVPVGFSLLVFATNGIWSIAGSEGFGFRANDYSVRKVSSVATLSASSFVDVDGTPMWWNSDGIYTVSQSETGSSSLQSLSDKKIKTYYQNIPITSKTYAKGAFNRYSKTVEWVFKQTPETDLTSRYEYDTVLVLNLLSGGFYKHEITSSAVKINGISVVEGTSVTSALETVTDNNLVTVTNAASQTVEVEVLIERSFAPVFKYLVSYADSGSYKMTFAEANNETYIDWAGYGDDVPYESYFITGYKLVAEANKKFQPTYIDLYFDNERFSTVDFQGIWDYATSGNTGRWSSVQRITFDDSRYSTVSARRKVRGHGKTLQFKVTSVENEPFNVTGWSTYYTSNQSP